MPTRAAGFVRFAHRCLAGPVEFLFQALVDFLIEDLCTICGKPSIEAGADVPGDPAGGVESTPGDPAACLLRPVRHRWTIGLAVRNHPICRRCVGALEPARGRSRLGVVTETGGIVTVPGEPFSPAGPTARMGNHPSRSVVVAPGAELSVVAPFMINDNLLHLIHLMKFAGYSALAEPMGIAMAAAYRAFGYGRFGDPVVVPVPRAAQERRRLGPDPTGRLASAFGRAAGAPVLENALIKTRLTHRQSQTPSEDRAANVRAAFSCRPRGIAGRPAVLLDDLVTTGATAAACAVELLAAGASDVEVVCFARAL
jgi:predicted amidophosphoribosyltransferase